MWDCIDCVDRSDCIDVIQGDQRGHLGLQCQSGPIIVSTPEKRSTCLNSSTNVQPVLNWIARGWTRHAAPEGLANALSEGLATYRTGDLLIFDNLAHLDTFDPWLFTKSLD